MGFDLPGHGLSEGKRIYVDQFKEYVDDLALFYQQVQIAYPACPAFILAHSMGTTVALSFLIAHEPSLAGLILSGTAIKVGSDISPFMISLSGIVGAIFPKLPTIALNSNTISRDRHVVEAYHNDPLVFNGKIPARTGSELNRTFTYLQKKLSEITAPILILHGAADQLTDPAGSKLLFNNISSQDKTLELFEGLYHEILNEPEKEEILALIADWISDRVV